MRIVFEDSGSRTQLNFSNPFISEKLGGLKRKLCTESQYNKFSGFGGIIAKLEKTYFRGQDHKPDLI